MKKKRSFCKWTSDEANHFCEILADAENNFVETLQKSALKKHPTVRYLIQLLGNLKKTWKMFSTKEKIQICGQGRSVSLKNLAIWNQKHSDNLFLNLTFCRNSRSLCSSEKVFLKIWRKRILESNIKTLKWILSLFKNMVFIEQLLWLLLFLFSW